MGAPAEGRGRGGFGRGFGEGGKGKGKGKGGKGGKGSRGRGGGGGGGDDEDGRASTNGIVRGIDCFYVRRGAAGSKTPMTMRRGSMRDARKTKLQR